MRLFARSIAMALGHKYVGKSAHGLEIKQTQACPKFLTRANKLYHPSLDPPCITTSWRPTLSFCLPLSLPVSWPPLAKRVRTVSMTSYLAAATMRAGAACSGAADARPIAEIWGSRICPVMAALVSIGSVVAAGNSCPGSIFRANAELLWVDGAKEWWI
jgi:hypothetical protein